MRTSIIVLVLVSSSTAVADDGTADPTRSPGFVNIARYDGNSRGGLDVMYFFLDGNSDTTLLRFDAHGHYVDPASGFGGYAQIPLSFASGNGDSANALGGLEVGGIFIPKLASPDLGIVLHVGLTLPTVPAKDDALLGVLAGYMRPMDFFQTIPESSTVRIGASPMVRSGKVFARLDVGVDLNVYLDGNDRADPGAHLNLGAGFDVGGAAIMGEFSAFHLFNNNGPDNTISVGALSVRGKVGAVQPYGALILPLNDDVTDAFNLALVVGVEGGI